MDLPLDSILSAAGGAGTAGGFTLWLAKRWIDRVDKQLESLAKKVNDIHLNFVKYEGREDGESKLVWREIDTDKRKIANLQSKVDRAWDVLSKLANPRISDMLRRETGKD